MFFISSSDKPDAWIMVFIGTPRDRRLAAIFTLAAFSPLAMPSAKLKFSKPMVHTGLPWRSRNIHQIWHGEHRHGHQVARD